MLSFTENLCFGTMKKMNISVVKCCYSNHIGISQELLYVVMHGIAAQLTAAPHSFNARAVRERFGGLVERFKAKNREKLVATGVSLEQFQLDVALKEIVQKMDEAELANETNENNANEKQSKEMEYAKDLREM